MQQTDGTSIFCNSWEALYGVKCNKTMWNDVWSCQLLGGVLFVCTIVVVEWCCYVCRASLASLSCVGTRSLRYKHITGLYWTVSKRVLHLAQDLYLVKDKKEMLKVAEPKLCRLYGGMSAELVSMANNTPDQWVHIMWGSHRHPLTYTYTYYKRLIYIHTTTCFYYE